MADMTLVTMAAYIFQVYSRLPTITYRSNTVSTMFLDRRWEPELGAGVGKAVIIPGFTQNNSAKNRGAGTGTFGTGAAITFDAATESTVTLTVNRFYYKADRQPVEALGRRSAQKCPAPQRFCVFEAAPCRRGPVGYAIHDSFLPTMARRRSISARS